MELCRESSRDTIRVCINPEDPGSGLSLHPFLVAFPNTKVRLKREMKIIIKNWTPDTISSGQKFCCLRTVRSSSSPTLRFRLPWCLSCVDCIVLEDAWPDKRDPAGVYTHHDIPPHSMLGPSHDPGLGRISTVGKEGEIGISRGLACSLTLCLTTFCRGQTGHGSRLLLFC